MTEREKSLRLLYGNRPPEPAPSVQNPQLPVPSAPISVPRSLGTESRQPNAPAAPRHDPDMRSVRSRQRRKFAQLNVSIPSELVDALKDKAWQDRRTVADVIEQLVFSYVAVPNAPAVPRHLSNLMIDDTVCANAINIINHQCAALIPNRKVFEFTEKDARAVEKWVRENGPVDESGVQIAIATTMMRTTEEKISSVGYFFQELSKAMKLMTESQREEMAPTRVWRLKRDKPELYGEVAK